jgi:nanoRNase/pAp phosphatase (c-di-AMP/oligoRNAs hydrolase)
MSTHVNPDPDAVELGMEVILAEEEKAVYVKITGFETVEEADDYGNYLMETLPLMLFESEVKH